MPVINKLIKKIRTCGLQKSPDPERSGPGVFFCVYITPDSTAWSIPHRDAESREYPAGMTAIPLSE